jgi:hypothetical protein
MSTRQLNRAVHEPAIDKRVSMHSLRHAFATDPHQHVPAVSSLEGCPTAAPKPHRARTARRATAAVGQPLTVVDGRDWQLSEEEKTQQQKPQGDGFDCRKSIALVSI